MDELAYDERRLRQWLAGEARGFSRRTFLALGAAVTAASIVDVRSAHARPAARSSSRCRPSCSPCSAPTPRCAGRRCATRATSCRSTGSSCATTPAPRSSTPATWRLEVFGAGLRGGAGVLLAATTCARLPAETRSRSAVECAGNGRSYFTTQQGQTVSGTAWGLGAVGVARWRGVRLSTVLRQAGLSPAAPSTCMPTGLDPNYVTGGVDLGPVRRPMPVAQGPRRRAARLRDERRAAAARPRPPGARWWCRAGSASPRSSGWAGSRSSAEPLFSPWNTQFYRLFGPGFPADGPAVRPPGRSRARSSWTRARPLPAGRRTALTRPLLVGRRPDPRTSRSAPTAADAGAGPARSARPARPGSAGSSTGGPPPGAHELLRPRHRRPRQHPAGRGPLQHPRLPLRRRGPASRSPRS